MTFPNRISLAGALPVLVAVAVVAIVAAIALAPSRSADAVEGSQGCDLSPVILDMLLDRYGLEAHDCDNLDLMDTGDPADGADNETLNTDDGHTVNTWDFSGKGLTEFAITKDDADILKRLTDDALTDNEGVPNGPVVEAAVRYIDLTGNPLSIEDVSAANIPARVAVRISVEANVAGFQSTEYAVTEGTASFITVAFPGLRDDDDAGFAARVSLEGDAEDAVNRGIAAAGAIKRTLISFGDQGGTGATNDERDLPLNSEGETIVFAWPITVSKDNENNEDPWVIELSIPETITGLTNSIDGGDFELTNPTADVLVSDADAPALSVCERSEDVQAAIVETAERAAAANTTDSTGAFLIYGGHNDCEDLTLTDLGRMASGIANDARADSGTPLETAQTGVFWVEDADGDNEPLENLISGDFEGLSSVSQLHIRGARNLPSGIFAGVGKADGNTVEITFANNTSGDADVEKVGNIKPSTIPQHIWEDQETQQIITLTDDQNADEEGITSGLDESLYTGIEGEHFFVLTNSATSVYVLAEGLDFTTATLAGPSSNATEADRLIRNAGGGAGTDSSRVSRFAVMIPDDVPEEKDDENRWLFLFENADVAGGLSALNVTDIVDMAVVAVTDDD